MKVWSLVWAVLLCDVRGHFATDSEWHKSDVEPLSIDSPIDHFNNRQKGTFKQRYWESREYWDFAKPKAVLYVCGVYPPCGLPGPSLLPHVAARETKALLFSLEHRFYGGSQPMPDWSVSSLRYLTPSQAAADIVGFIDRMNAELNRTYKAIPKWVLIGGSYAGGVAAWTRFKYSHVVSGAVVSSGVIHARLALPEYEGQMLENLRKCDGSEKAAEQVRSYQDYATAQMLSPDPETRERFLRPLNASGMSMLEFAYYFAELPTYALILSRLNETCDLLTQLRKSGFPLQEQIRLLARGMAQLIGLVPERYRLSYLRNITLDQEKLDRQWLYQSCTTFGWLQTPYAPNPLRWTGMNLTYWGRHCAALFGSSFPDIDHTNVILGGESIAREATHLFFSQSVEDGWQWAGIRENLYRNPHIEVAMINCTGCSHCMDLKPARDTDPPVLKEVRLREIEAINSWLS